MDAKKLKLTPKMLEAILGIVRYELDPMRIPASTRIGLINRGLLAPSGTATTQLAEDLEGQVRQEATCLPFDEALEAAHYEKEHQFNEGVFFAHLGAGSDNNHPEFLAGYAHEQYLSAWYEAHGEELRRNQQASIGQEEADFEEARGDFGVADNEPCAACGAPNRCASIYTCPNAKRPAPVALVSKMAKRKGWPILRELGRISKYMPQTFMETAVLWLVQPEPRYTPADMAHMHPRSIDDASQWVNA